MLILLFFRLVLISGLSSIANFNDVGFSRPTKAICLGIADVPAWLVLSLCISLVCFAKSITYGLLWQ